MLQFTSVIADIIVGILIVVVIATAVRYSIYVSELREFQNGMRNETRHKHHVSRSVLMPLRMFDADKTIVRHIREAKMLYAKHGTEYCCFTRLFSDLPIKLLISVVEVPGNGVRMEVNCYDRYLQPVMTQRLRNRFERQMQDITAKFCNIVVNASVLDT